MHDNQWRIQDFPQVGAPTYDFAKISQKLHELKEFGPQGGGARPKFYYVDPPLTKNKIRLRGGHVPRAPRSAIGLVFICISRYRCV